MRIEKIQGNWYGLYGGQDNLEYNQNPGVATLPNHDDRQPMASVFRSSDGDKVVVQIWCVLTKSFFYKEHGYGNAIDIAKKFVEKYFSKPRNQIDIFE